MLLARSASSDLIERKRLTMIRPWYVSALVASVLMFPAPTGVPRAEGQAPAKATEVTLKGSMVCNGACVPNPKAEDHGMVLFAIDGTAEIRAEVDKIMKDFYQDKGLD